MNSNFAGIRNDIGHFTKDTRVANLCRVFIFENKHYEINSEIFKVNVKVNIPSTDINFEGNSNENNIITEIKEKELKPDVIDLDGLFGEPNTLIIIKNKIAESTAELYSQFRSQYPDKKLLIISDDNYFIQEDIISYTELEKKYKPSIPLWEHKLQNIINKPDLYVKDWVIGKRELKRKHPKFFKVGKKNLKTGILWKRPCQRGYHGRPKDPNGKFIDVFEIRDMDGNVFEQNSNWGAILARVAQIIKDNPYIYYNTGKKLSVYGHSKNKKSGEETWWKFVDFDAMKNYWQPVDLKGHLVIDEEGIAKWKKRFNVDY